MGIARGRIPSAALRSALGYHCVSPLGYRALARWATAIYHFGRMRHMSTGICDSLAAHTMISFTTLAGRLFVMICSCPLWM